MPPMPMPPIGGIIGGIMGGVIGEPTADAAMPTPGAAAVAPAVATWVATPSLPMVVKIRVGRGASRPSPGGGDPAAGTGVSPVDPPGAVIAPGIVAPSG